MSSSTTVSTSGHAVDHVVDLRSDLTAQTVAEIFGCSPRKVWTEARRHGIGFNLGGRAGWRFTEADVDKLRKAMAPPAPVKGRRVA